MKVTKSYLKQLIMEELGEGWGPGHSRRPKPPTTDFNEPDAVQYDPESDPDIKAIRDRSEQGDVVRDLKAALNKRLNELVYAGQVKQPVAEELMAAIGSRFKPR